MTESKRPKHPHAMPVPPGCLEVGISADEREIIVNHPEMIPSPDGRGGHIVFSPQQALDFAETMLRKIAECKPCDSSITAASVVDVLAERIRQVSEKGWTSEHDDEHADGSLASVASCYALPPASRMTSKMSFNRDVGRSAGESIIVRDWVDVPLNWPQSWHGGAWNPKDDRRRELVIAGALILAEIERLCRGMLCPGCNPHVWPHGPVDHEPSCTAIEVIVTVTPDEPL